MYGDQSGEFECGSCGLKGLVLGAVYMEGRRSQNQGDPRSRNNFLLGLQAGILVCVVTK